MLSFLQKLALPNMGPEGFGMQRLNKLKGIPPASATVPPKLLKLRHPDMATAVRRGLDSRITARRPGSFARMIGRKI